MYLLPSGYTFAIWGIIYTLLILFAIYQVLPAQRDDAACVAARPYATAALVLNGAWLVVSGNQLYWMALIIIAGYWYFLLKAVDAVDAVLDKQQADNNAASASSAPAPWKTHLFVRAGLTANLAWVTVATLLQLSISLLEAGFFPYADFSLGLLAGALAFAALRVCPRCDATYALASVWALLGVVHNQTSAGSTWGCASYICTAKCVDGTFGICARDGTSVGGLPVGFKSLCAGYAPGDVDQCVVPKSAAVAHWCYAGIGIVAVALVLGLARKVLRARRCEYGAGRGSDAVQPGAGGDTGAGVTFDGLETGRPVTKVPLLVSKDCSCLY